MYNVVLDILIMDCFIFLLKIFSKRLKSPLSFLWHAFVCLDQCPIIRKNSIFRNNHLCQNLKVRYFRYINFVKQSYEVAGSFQNIFDARRSNPWLLRLITKDYVICVCLGAHPKNHEKSKC